jgi:hypothetical protein
MAAVRLHLAKGDGPRFPLRTLANTRRDRHMTAQSLDEFESALGAVAWFANLGQPSPWDVDCTRIHAWDQWPGPENGPAEALALMTQDMYDRIFAASPIAADALQALFDRLSAAVTSRAQTAVPFEPDQDAWHGPTLCVWVAAYVAGLIGCVLASGWPVPDDLVELWNWFEAGHWPASFAPQPGDGRDIFEDESSFPRQLLVY